MGNRLSNMTAEEREDLRNDRKVRARTTSIQEYLRFKYVCAGRGGDVTEKFLQYQHEGGHVKNTIMVHMDFRLVECQIIDADIKVIEESENTEAFVLAADILLPSGLTLTAGKSFIAEKGYYPDWDKILIKWNY